MKRYLILGKNGMLGFDLQRAFHDRDFIAAGRDEFDIRSEDSLRELIMKAQPDVIINATAYKDVNKAEEEEEVANEINGYAVGRLAKICRDFEVTLVHFSSDYVFAGLKEGGYKEEDGTGPLNAYGRSKLLGEDLLIEAMESEIGDSAPGKYFIIRTSYLFGVHSPNLVSKILDQAKKGLPFKVIADQYSKLTYTLDLAQQIKWLIESNEYDSDIYHITNSGTLSWYELAKFLLLAAGLDEKLIEKCRFEDWQAAAARPKYSALINNKLPELRSWKDAIKEYLTELKL